MCYPFVWPHSAICYLLFKIRIRIMVLLRRARKYKPRAKPRTKAMVMRTSTRGVSVPRGVYGFPETLTTVIRYNDVWTIQGTSGGTGGNVVRMNSCYDPDYSGLGHQPLYYDQFTPIYDNYVVLASTVTANFSPLTDDTETTTTGPYTVGITGSNSPTFSTSSTVLAEQNKSVTTVVGRDKGTSVASLTLSYTPRQCLGKSPDDDVISATVGNNPSMNWYANLWCADDNGTSGSVKVRATITYRVRFFNLKPIATS